MTETGVTEGGIGYGLHASQSAALVPEVPRPGNAPDANKSTKSASGPPPSPLSGRSKAARAARPHGSCASLPVPFPTGAAVSDGER